MGGSAFAQAYAPSVPDKPTLNTPRMSPTEYLRLKGIYLKKTQDYFPDASVASLKEAPEKDDHGDVDILVGVDQPVDFVHLANQIGAVAVLDRTSNDRSVQTCTLAVLRDGSASTAPVLVYRPLHENGAGGIKHTTSVTREEYAQVDLEIVPSRLIAWHTFYASYGDLAYVLGSVVRDLGFKINDKGLWLRLKELDSAKTVQNLSMADEDGVLLLSGDPERVMEFLGLSVEGYQEGFQTRDEFYTWLSRCRLLSAAVLQTKRESAHERQLERTRTGYARFFHDWLPAHMDLSIADGKETQVKQVEILRQRHLEEAIVLFGKAAEYGAMHHTAGLIVKNGIAANAIRALIALHSGRNSKGVTEILRAFRRRVGFNADGRPCVLDKPHPDAESKLYHFLADDGTSLKDQEAVSEWVRGNWEALRSLERAS